MAETHIDQSKLPGVKEVCRDFAVLEDHTLAHSLQEQEIEHHLATNIQRNRLVKHDLQVAKQLQEEEDLKARAQIQKHRKDIERQDCEIAQEIQVKLVIEAEQRRRQEEKDEDIARILQEKLLLEDKKRKKPEPQGHKAYENSYYAENGDCTRDTPRGPASEPARPRRPRSGNRHQHREHPRETRALPGDGAELEHPSLEDPHPGRTWDSQPCSREMRERKPGSQERSRRPRSPGQDREAEYASLGHSRSWEPSDRKGRREEKTSRPHSLNLDAEAEPPNREPRERKPSRPDREKRLPSFDVDLEAEQGAWKHGSKHSPRPESRRAQRQGLTAPRDTRLGDSEESQQHDRRRGEEREQRKAGRRPRASPSPHAETRERGRDRCRDPGMKPRGTKQATYDKPRLDPREQELYDAEIARKLQEEELLANRVDQRAAQVAQDEEIARLLMAEEKKKVYRKSREREKPSYEKKRQDQDWKDPSESVRPRSREGHEAQRHKTARPPPPLEDFDQACFPSQPSAGHQLCKPEQSHKGPHHRQ
ncbi:coiled-coil domain-containing protein 50 isoform X1 [Alligator mississippiensis]|uniref:coiled-coil domain-containing protein 50 isoform X1 n=1 Tax=Alligator mississippiensis TaxID=8496 RepID=UPI00287813C9|nr:coiled-coil domain-containing protein 50 isoform X1 [Alligator mississippiensis]